VGAAKALITIRSWWASGFEITWIGALEGVVTYVIGIGLGKLEAGIPNDSSLGPRRQIEGGYEEARCECEVRDEDGNWLVKTPTKAASKRKTALGSTG
jgi:hypothetical protein